MKIFPPFDLLFKQTPASALRIRSVRAFSCSACFWIVRRRGGFGGAGHHQLSLHSQSRRRHQPRRKRLWDGSKGLSEALEADGGDRADDQDRRRRNRRRRGAEDPRIRSVRCFDFERIRNERACRPQRAHPMHFDNAEVVSGVHFRIFGRNLYVNGKAPTVTLIDTQTNAQLKATVAVATSSAYYHRRYRAGGRRRRTYL